MNNFLSNFPYIRPRRLRKEEWIRTLVQENILRVENLILPIFLTYEDKSNSIKTMPNVYRNTVNDAVALANQAHELGIKAVALFPEVPEEKKDVMGKEALNDMNIVCKTVREIKKNINQLGIICDVALDPYTLSGHDGVYLNNEVNNDETLKVLCNQALVNAEAGCDIIAPSDMMDGRIKSIRESLDKASFQNTLIMSYAAKYASVYYSPFRNAISASSDLGPSKKKTYQMDYNNIDEALKEVSLDIKEGADIILIKPGMPYLDVLSIVKKTFNYPTFSYQVSGEYSMISRSIEEGLINKEEAIIETLSCFKRAGANAILTYFAIEAAKIIHNG
ncbi:MAG: porphobilinogen synthase [Rickettsiales bacterium]|nr:porphobilinogen synthase [Rickettsiales bacterium]OUV83109.1 MAG: delta-aminolevulinic acid dehydratase [Rickettsiales bacterium TMED131]